MTGCRPGHPQDGSQDPSRGRRNGGDDVACAHRGTDAAHRCARSGRRALRARRDAHRRHVAGRAGLGPAGLRRPRQGAGHRPRPAGPDLRDVHPRRLSARRVDRVRRGDRRRGPGHAQGADRALGLRPPPQRRPRPGPVHPGRGPRRRRRGRAVRPHRGRHRLRAPLGRGCERRGHPPGLPADPAGLLHGGVPAPRRERSPRTLGAVGRHHPGDAGGLRAHADARCRLLRPAGHRLGCAAGADAGGTLAARRRRHDRERRDPVRPRPVRGPRRAAQPSSRAGQRPAAGLPARLRPRLPAVRDGGGQVPAERRRGGQRA